MKPLQPIDTINIPNPKDYFCSVAGYSGNPQDSYNELSIQVQNTIIYEDRFDIVFSFVSVFSGLLTWKGVNLRVADQAENLKFLRTLSSTYSEYSDDQLLDYSRFGRLHLFETDDRIIRIVAIGFQLFESPF
jgi:hypothetical protein